ncbi:aspartic peptidase domain-containing protein [Calycina marina]|uniref:Probable aspartic-type endopeptidase OPSB n=1 Tax=Calycina marina TaxID=1763456 RepID=A0A9P8CIF2_9HELO|nr:aspartic peptidase domain-containing protein [Calycina marina]
MKGSIIIATAIGILSPCIEALTLQQRTTGAPRVVRFDIERREVQDPAARDSLRRRGTASATLDNLLTDQVTLYFANATLGTPAQTLRLHIDTGSSDLWVNTPTSTLCSSQGECDTAGTYTANSSSTYSYVSSDFNISYVDGSGASGDYVTDTITFGTTTLDDLQFGIGYESSSAQGILGIGYEVNEVQVSRVGKSAYQNLPAKLVADSVIASNAYSLWLDDLASSTGSILFGGVDKAKYTGSLQTLPIQQYGGQYSEFLVTMTGITMGGATVAENLAEPVLFDSGSSLTYLPDSITESIYESVSAQYSAEDGTAFVPCSLANSNSTIDFTFSSPVISVPMDEMVITVYSSTGRQLTFTDGTDACLFGIAPSGSGVNVFGDTFLRSAYVVFDLDNNEISIAQTNFSATTSDILEIASGTAGVPGATAVTDSVAATGISSTDDTSSSILGSINATSTVYTLPMYG